MAKFSSARMYQEVTKQLHFFGMKSNACYFDYIRQIAMMYIEDPENREKKLDEMFQAVSEDTGIDKKTVSNNVRAAVYRLKRTNDFTPVFQNFVNVQKDFIEYIADQAIKEL